MLIYFDHSNMMLDVFYYLIIPFTLDIALWQKPIYSFNISLKYFFIIEIIRGILYMHTLFQA